MDFSGLFKIWCAKRGIAPSDGAAFLGYSRDSGCRWARGDSKPPMNKIRELSGKMGIRESALLEAIERSRRRA